MTLPDQPEPCLGGPGTHDRGGHCYSAISCGTFGYCRERAVHHKGERTKEIVARWIAEAKQRHDSTHNI